jgi:hypothetical protein
MNQLTMITEDLPWWETPSPGGTLSIQAATAEDATKIAEPQLKALGVTPTWTRKETP